MTQKQIKGFNLDELIVMCEENNFSAFRAKQIYHWMYRHGALDISDMKNLPDDLLKYLKNKLPTNQIRIFQNLKK